METVKPFDREERYLVLKYSDINQALTPEAIEQLAQLTHTVDACRRAANKPVLEAVVVEKDWPEYEPVWAMIENRVNGQPSTDYRAWYEEAMAAANEAGFAGMTAADVIRQQAQMLEAKPSSLGHDELYDVQVNGKTVAKSVNEKEAWRVIGLGHLGHLHEVFYAGTTDIAEKFVPY